MKRHFKTLSMVVTCMALALCVSCKKDNNEPTSGSAGVPGDSDGSFFGHAYVDLGLPSGTLWATCNVGAMISFEYGLYFAWGETSDKSTYNRDNYKWHDDTHDFTKYNSEPMWGIVDNKTVLDPEDDAAYINWDGNWRMPTFDEMKELIDKCTWKWFFNFLYAGYKVTGPNGKSIFLPAAGYYVGSSLHHTADLGSYWLSSLEGPNYAYYLSFSSNSVFIDSDSRENGLSIRPVWSPQK